MLEIGCVFDTAISFTLPGNAAFISANCFEMSMLQRCGSSVRLPVFLAAFYTTEKKSSNGGKQYTYGQSKLGYFSKKNPRRWLLRYDCGLRQKCSLKLVTNISDAPLFSQLMNHNIGAIKILLLPSET